MDLTNHTSPLYSPLGIEYQQAYSGPYEGISTNNMVAALKQGEISGFGRPVIDNGNVQTDEIHQLWHVSDRIWYRDYLIKGLSRASMFLMRNGLVPTPYYRQMIDLSQDNTVLFSKIRRSYKQLVKQWKDYEIVVVNSSYNELERLKHLTAFKELHTKCAGRQTRDPKTWRVQSRMIAQKEAFLVLAYQDGLKAGAFFVFNKKTSYYFCSACEDNSHFIIWRGILHSKKIGVRWVDMGERIFDQSHKQYGISQFKGGFGGKVQVCLEFKL
ncbi:MAG: hypothetical protein AMJ75_00285 [Phycisphaerae bacterium SM1_79]|nr:MAG: hypothetical protein AMJ75_00285 [Phycisphaerae bacterium SM1_79]